MSEFIKKYQVEGDNWKDKVQYIVASTSFASGVAMAFISFLMSGTISGEVLGFIGECFTLTGGIFGITLYIRNKVSSAGAYIMDSVQDLLKDHKVRYHDDLNEDEDADDTSVDKEPLADRR